jgi:hypothetical protein
MHDENPLAGKELHHMSYPKAKYASEVTDSEHLLPASDEVHRELHRLQGAEGVNQQGTPARFSDMVLPGDQPKDVRRALQRHFEFQNPNAQRSYAQAHEELRALSFDKTTKEISQLGEQERNAYTVEKAALTHYRESAGWSRAEGELHKSIDFVQQEEGRGVAVRTVAKPNAESAAPLRETIDQLARLKAEGAEAGGRPLALELDVRVPKGKLDRLEMLKDYGTERNVPVRINGY